MCSSDKQNMAHEIENLLDIAKNLYKKWLPKNKGKESEKEREDIERKIKEIEDVIKNNSIELEKLVKKLRGSIDKGESSGSTSMGKLTEAEINHVRNVVDLSVTGLTEESLLTFWGTLEQFHNLTRLGVAVTNGTHIKLPDSKYIPKKLKENLERLRMEGQHSGLEYLRAFGVLNDLTLVSHRNMDFGKIPNRPKLLCLRLYGVCPNETCEIDLNGCPNLKKLVIGNMETVEKNGSAVLKKVVTLKFTKLPMLEGVTDTNTSANPHSLLRWEESTTQVCSEKVKPNKTLFLKKSAAFPGLKIYCYDKKNQCYKLNAA